MSFTVIVPHATLAPHLLRAVIEEFVTREGTDYGPSEHSLEQKCAAVVKQLERREAFIAFDPETESVTVLHRDEVPAEP